jgi:hypothetical protein
MTRAILLALSFLVLQNSVPRREPVDKPAGVDALQTQDLSQNLTVQDVIAALLGSQSIAISNVRYTGSDSALGTFIGGTGIIGFENGIILSSGQINHVIGPNQYSGVTGDNGRPGDPDLDSLIPGFQTQDAAILEFDFTCEAVRKIGFQYVFASDEYDEFVHNQYNDVFGFFVNGKNVALLPDGKTVVSINSVNGGNPFGDTTSENRQYFRDNDNCQGDSSCQINTEMDGLTVVLVAEAEIHPGLNHIKLAIADAGDASYDSDVFLKGQSFVCGIVNNSAPLCSASPAGPLNGPVNTLVGFTVTGTDPDSGQTIYLSALGNLPAGASMTPALPLAGPRTGVSSQFSWRPTQPGTYFANFFLTDSLGGADTCTVQINAINNSPVCTITPPGPFTVHTAAAVNFTVTGSDPDSGQSIHLSVFDALPGGATMTPSLPLDGPSTGISSQFSWQPTQPGTYVARFQLSDGLGGLDTSSAQITVVATDLPPFVAETNPANGAHDIPWPQFPGIALFISRVLIDSTIPAIIPVHSRRFGTLEGHLTQVRQSTRLSLVLTTPWPDDDSLSFALPGTMTGPDGAGLDGNRDGVSEGSPADDYNYWITTSPGVYPGDANDDGAVDERDILPLGNYWLMQGPGRSRSFNAWTVEPATPWDPRGATFADCDGNGVVDSLDICTILEFFEHTELGKRSSATRIDALSALDGDVRAALARALINCNQGTAEARAALLAALTQSGDNSSGPPKSFQLLENYPNPFNAGTIIRWEQAAAGHADLSIFDILGHPVRNVIYASLPAGLHTLAWDGKTEGGAVAASGIYVARLRTEHSTQTHLMVLVR